MTIRDSIKERIEAWVGGWSPPGGRSKENELLSRSLISASFLDPLKARLLLHVLPSGDASREQVAAAFAA